MISAGPPFSSDQMRSEGTRISEPFGLESGLHLFGVVVHDDSQSWRRSATKAAKMLGYAESAGAGRKCLGQVSLAMQYGECGDVLAELRSPDSFNKKHLRRLAQSCQAVYRLCLRRKPHHKAHRTVCWAVKHGGTFAIAMSIPQAIELCVRQHEALLGIKRP